MGTAAARIRTRPETRTHVRQKLEKHLDFWDGDSEPGPRNQDRGKTKSRSKISIPGDMVHSKLGKFLEAPVRITTDAPGAVWAHFSEKRKERNWFTILYTYRCIIDKQFNLSLLHKKKK